MVVVVVSNISLPLGHDYFTNRLDHELIKFKKIGFLRVGRLTSKSLQESSVSRHIMV